MPFYRPPERITQILPGFTRNLRHLRARLRHGSRYAKIAGVPSYPVSHATSMQKTTLIYCVLGAFFSLGIVVDWVGWQGVPPAPTWNDVTQMIGVITLCLY